MDAGAATPSSQFLKGPLTIAPRFDPGGSSLPLPFFINTSSGASQQASSSCSCPDHNTCQSNIAPLPTVFPLSYTFYQPPSTSRSSLASSSWLYDPCNTSRETQSTMPGPTFDAPADQFLLFDTTDYFSTSACASRDSTTNITELRPRSVGSGRGERAPSPLVFPRWAKRHHHHHHDHSTSYRAGQGTHGYRGLDCGLVEYKPKRKSSPKRSGRSRSNSIQTRQAQVGAVPQMTREEFEALPLAIQRKVCYDIGLVFTIITCPCWNESCSSAWLGKKQTSQEPTPIPSRGCHHWLILQVLGPAPDFTSTLPAPNGNCMFGLCLRRHLRPILGGAPFNLRVRTARRAGMTQCQCRHPDLSPSTP